MAARCCAALGCLLVALAPAAAEDPAQAAALVREVLATAPLIDGHNDVPWQIRKRFANHLDRFDFRDTSGLEPAMHTDLARLRRGDVDAQFFSVWVPSSLAGGDAVVAVLEQVDLVRRLVAAYADDLELALSSGDVRRIHGAGRIACLIGMEGGHGIAESLAVLRQMYGLGVRYLTLSHWDTNSWVDAATAAPRWGGLSPFGEEVVREMNRLGMMVDLSHVSADAMTDALQVSRAPVIFSHSNAAALNPHPRNVPDEVLSLLAANGGVVMVNFGSFFVAESHVRRWAGVKAERARLETLFPGHPEAVETGLQRWYEAHPIPPVGVAELADHVDHIRAIAGIDHVGLGSDYDGIEALPTGLEDVAGYPRLLEELAGRGYDAEALAKIAGGNLLRVMAEVERTAALLQATEAPRATRFDELPAD